MRAIAESIANIGLHTPITVREKHDKLILVSGLHRLKAAKLLGWSKIDALILTGGKIDARCGRTLENLHRADLTVLERAERIDEWRKLIRKKAAQVGRPGGRQPKEAGIAKTAKQWGFSRAEVGRAQKIAAILPEVKTAAEKAGLANNQARLLAIANAKTLEAQQQTLQEIVEGKNASGRKKSKQHSPETDLEALKADLVTKIKRNRELRAKVAALRDVIKKLRRVRGKLKCKLIEAEQKLSGNSW